jgi:putative DNA methylase
MDSSRFLIETVLPLEELSKEARREKAIRHGHISTLHVWWARRPLVVARAAVLGALVTVKEFAEFFGIPLSEEKSEQLLAKIREFFQELCKWEVHDGNPAGREILEKARALVRKRFPDGPPKVLDSFAGGGSIPLEALRLGCQAYALEYNPVAYLILKATIEYPQRYGPRLAAEVRRWGEWVLEQARRELAPFYPEGRDGTPIAYIWSRTVRCANPACRAEVPLFHQFWLARKKDRQVALKPIPNREAKRLDFAIVEGKQIDFDPAQGTVRGGNAVCLICQTAMKVQYIRSEAQAGRLGHRLVAIVTTSGRGRGRHYVLPTEQDFDTVAQAGIQLSSLISTQQSGPMANFWWTAVPVLPEESIEASYTRDVRLQLYGHTTWASIFNPRQLLALITFGKWVRAAYREMVAKTGDQQSGRVITTYLAIAFDKMSELMSVLSAWDPGAECVRHIFTRHALSMVWDYAESNPLATSSGSWLNTIEIMLSGKALFAWGQTPAQVVCSSASNLPCPNHAFGAVVIDPPYADNVPYADLSDFFYVWLRRIVGDLYPEAFRTTLVPKEEEAVVNPARFGGGKKGLEISQKHYQYLLRKSFEEIYRVLRPEGMAVVMFTHRSTEAWERLILSLLAAGLYPTASLPVHTEMEASTHQWGKGAIQSTILMGCRRRPENAPIGWYHQVLTELREGIPQRLSEFWQAGIRGADFFISAIGPAVGIFGKYSKVMHPDGREVDVEDLLEECRRIVTHFAVHQLGVTSADEATRFYALYRWAYGGEELSFDEANKLAKSVGIELDVLTSRHELVVRTKDRVRLPTFADRFTDYSEPKAVEKFLQEAKVESWPQIDSLHLALRLWKRAWLDPLGLLLARLGVDGEVHPFWATAQALLEIEEPLANGPLAEEVRNLSQLLTSKRSLSSRAKNLAESQQMRLPGI